MATKKCPYCGEEIDSEALKCRYCKEWLTDEARKESEKENDSEEIDDSEGVIADWLEDYGWILGRVVLCVIAAAVLFFTNPKSTDRHADKILDHFEDHVKEMRLDVKQSLSGSGLEAYYVEKVFNDVVEAKKEQLRKDVDVTSYGLFSLGSSGNLKTIGVLGMVFNISWLSAGDSLNELEIADDVLDQVNADVRTINTLKRLFY